MPKVKLTRSIWAMNPGDTLLIDPVSTGRFRKACERRERQKPYVFTIEKVNKETSKITCYDDFDAPEKPHATKKRHPLHFLPEGESLYASSLDEVAWRSAARYIERKSAKRFLFTRDPRGFKVQRLPDGADKTLYKRPKSKYNFDKIEPDETRFYLETLDLRHVLNAMRAYEKKTGFGFDAEWVEGGLNITRLW